MLYSLDELGIFTGLALVALVYLQIGGYFFGIDFWALGNGLPTPIPWPWR